MLMLQAAARAATRTAEFATTGDWPEEEEDAMSPAKHRAARQDSGSSGSVSVPADSPVD